MLLLTGISFCSYTFLNTHELADTLYIYKTGIGNFLNTHELTDTLFRRNRHWENYEILTTVNSDRKRSARRS